MGHLNHVSAENKMDQKINSQKAMAITDINYPRRIHQNALL